MKSSLICAALLSLLCIAPAAVNAAPADYQFARIEDSSGRFADFHPPAINNRNTVAFTAVLRSGDVGVFRKTGSTTATVLGSGAARRSVAINDSDAVAFARAFGPDGGGGLFINQNGRTSTVMSEGLITEWSINAQGVVAFNRRYEEESNALYIFGGGRLTQIPDSQNGDGPTINAYDVVLFNRLETDYTGLYVSIGGKRPILILDSEASPLWNFGHASLNKHGQVVFTANTDPTSDGRIKTGIYVLDGKRVSKILDNTGPFNGFYRAISINNLARLAFLAALDSDVEGIFTGPDPVRDKVVAVGDALLGSRVAALAFGKFGYNDSGSLAFLATLADGRKALVRADRIRR